ncbi:MAG: S41 family peptidase [Verrucomicrobiota bacterium]
MLKRILSIASGVVLGLAVSVGAAHFATLWGLWPNRDLNRSTDTLRTVLQLVNEHYVDAKAAGLPGLTEAALTGLVGTLDPHSEYMNAAAYKAFDEDLSSKFGGIGVQVELLGGRVVVITPIAGTPGERAGIVHGDEIVSIDGQKLAKAAMEDVVTRLRGQPGTAVMLGLFRPAEKKEVTLTLTRESIHVDSVRDPHLLRDGVGYVQLTQFSESTPAEFGRAVRQLQAQNMKALVIDLRNNPGGLLDAVVEVAGLFFKPGELIVYTQGRDPGDREEFRAKPGGGPLALPLAVLINASSASAAEILAGALQDTHRAAVVGERSFGKGSVQSIFPLGNHDGLRLTIARYYTPGGAVIHGHGISPDVEVVATPDEDRSLALQRSRSDVTDPMVFQERFGVALVPDRQLDAATAILRAALRLKAN